MATKTVVVVGNPNDDDNNNNNNNNNNNSLLLSLSLKLFPKSQSHPQPQSLSTDVGTKRSLDDEDRATSEHQHHEKKLRVTRPMDGVASSYCGSVLQQVMKQMYSKSFHKPVDPVKWGLADDYFQIVKNPMDLGTVKTKLDGNRYKYVDDFEADVRLTFANAMLYHRPGSQIYQYAKNMVGSFDSLWKPNGEMTIVSNGSANTTTFDNKCPGPATLLACSKSKGVGKTKPAVSHRASILKKLRCRKGRAVKSVVGTHVPLFDMDEESAGSVSNVCEVSCLRPTLQSPMTATLQKSDSCSEMVIDNAAKESTTLDVQLSPSKAALDEGKKSLLTGLQSKSRDYLNSLNQKGSLHAAGAGAKLTEIKLQKEKLERAQREQKAKMEAEARAVESAKAEFERQRQRKIDRENARTSLEKMQRAVDVEDNFHVLKELEKILGRPLFVVRDCPKSFGRSWTESGQVESSKPLEKLGLFIRS